MALGQLQGIDDLDKWTRELKRWGQQNIAEQAARTVFRRTAAKAKTATSRRIRSYLNLKASVVNPHIRTHYRPSAGTINIFVSGQPVGLEHFGARFSGLGVSYRIARGGPLRRLTQRSFINDKSRDPLDGFVFTRRGRSRLKIDRRYGTSIAYYLRRPSRLAGWSELVFSDADQETIKEIRRQVARIKIGGR